MFEIRGGRFGRMPSQLRELLNKFYSLLCAFSSLSHKTSSGDNIRPEAVIDQKAKNPPPWVNALLLNIFEAIKP